MLRAANKFIPYISDSPRLFESNNCETKGPQKVYFAFIANLRVVDPMGALEFDGNSL